MQDSDELPLEEILKANEANFLDHACAAYPQGSAL